MKRICLVLLVLFVTSVPVLADNATFSCPAGGEVWLRGADKMITYTFSEEISWYCLVLMRDGVVLGAISNVYHYSYPPGEYHFLWKVGEADVSSGWAPPGSGYQIGFECGDAPCPVGISQPFSISCIDPAFLRKIKTLTFTPLPKPGGCPQCFVLDLAALREELVKLDEFVVAALYWQGRQVAEFGRIGKGKGFAAKLQVKLGAEAMAAMKRGEEFELKLFAGRRTPVYSQPIRLVSSLTLKQKTQVLQKH
jgi:hypothetical protein